jgi:hypothetical protein
VRPAPPLLALGSVLLLALVARAEESPPAGDLGVPLGKVKAAFEKALKSKDPLARSRAFDHLREVREPAVVDEVVRGVGKVLEAQDAIRKAQKDTEAEYEQSIDALHEAQRDYEGSRQTGKDLDRYNARERKLSKVRDDAIQRLKNLENDFSRERGLEQQGVLVLGDLLEAMPEAHWEDALARLDAGWYRPQEPADGVRWALTLAAVRNPKASARLHAAVADPALSNEARAAAIDALAGRKDPALLAQAIQMLALPPDGFAVVTAAIGALRAMHDAKAIEPLIAFLEREDLGRLREDAHLALCSLTGQTHGPYAQMWRKWWQESAATFQMPPEPKPPGRVERPEKGVTFYGVHTFSEKVLFIVDISGSMDQASRATGDGGKPKWEIARRELIGAVELLDATSRFNVIFFNHQVIPWQPRIQTADDRTKKVLREWVEGQIPVGGTNIHDALDLGFFTAYAVTGPPQIDTVFFLTDGKPTAGRFLDPARILERVRERNATAKLRIHAIGIGDDHDAEFMKELARIGDGQYVAR